MTGQGRKELLKLVFDRAASGGRETGTDHPVLNPKRRA
jgi:hypothetical protein